MNKKYFSIRIKLMLLLTFMTIMLAGLLYLMLQETVENEIYKVEMQKAKQVAASMEPMISMKHYLKLTDGLKELGDDLVKNEDISGLFIYLDDRLVYQHKHEDEASGFEISFPIQDVISRNAVGKVVIHYSKDNYYNIIHSIQQRFFWLVGFIFSTFIVLLLIIRYLFKPLEQLGDVIRNYDIGKPIDFSKIQHEVETDSVVQLISDLVDRVNFHHKQMSSKQKELREAKEKADLANRSKSMFLANMSHEIRTPLNAIMGFIDLLAGMEKDALKRRYIHSVKTSSISLLGVINDILDFSKIESGKLDIEWHEFNPLHELKSVLLLYCAHCNDKGLFFDVRIDPKLPLTMRSDALRIKQVLSNLLSNAIKFTESGGTITVEIRYIPEEYSIFFGVKDTGIGITEANREKIFEAFSQGDVGTTRRFGGTGLGLSISLQLVAMLKGKLELDYKRQEGSHFFFCIPLSADETEAERFSRMTPEFDRAQFGQIHAGLLMDTSEYRNRYKIDTYLKTFHVKSVRTYRSINEVHPDACDILFIDAKKADERLQHKLDDGMAAVIYYGGYQEERHTFRGKCTGIECILGVTDLYDTLTQLLKGDSDFSGPAYDTYEVPSYEGRVLVVEDYEANRALMEALLQERNVTFDFALNGAEAVEMYRKHRYDLILMDENMPVMNGTEATKRILEIEKKEALEHVPIVALTANALKGDREYFLCAGMDDYLSKPVDRASFDLILSEHLHASTSTPKQANLTENEVVQPPQSGTVLDVAASKLRLPLPVIKKIGQVFITSANKTRGELSKAVANRDLEAIRHGAHALKGSAMNLHINTLAKLARELEQCAANEIICDYDALLTELLAVLDETIEEIEAACRE